MSDHGAHDYLGLPVYLAEWSQLAAADVSARSPGQRVRATSFGSATFGNGFGKGGNVPCGEEQWMTAISASWSYSFGRCRSLWQKVAPEAALPSPREAAGEEGDEREPDGKVHAEKCQPVVTANSVAGKRA